jgi:hypothetical protein
LPTARFVTAAARWPAPVGIEKSCVAKGISGRVEESVSFLDKWIEPQSHEQDRLWKPGETRRTLAGASP